MSCTSTRSGADDLRPKRTRLFQWVPTDEEQHLRAEQAMLAPIRGLYEQKSIAGINTLASTNATSGGTTTVLLHGFAGGVGQWVPQWRSIRQFTNLYAIDLPGFGRSKRVRTSFKTESDAINYYVDQLDKWFDESGIKGPVNLVGHSFGGYIAAQYAVRRHARISKLVLADPWGVPPKPSEQRQLPLKYRILLKLGFQWGNPLGLLRGLGPWGPTLLPKYRKDFAARWSGYHDNANVFYDYVYHSNANGHCTGEQAFAACADVDSGLYARLPLLKSIPDALPLETPMYLIYGDETWMDKAAGYALADMFLKRGGTTELISVPYAGHQVNVDNPEEFNRALLKVLGLSFAPADAEVCALDMVTVTQ
jgi:pimeloyl-ACP methyl ester carboxylesterase